MDLLRWKVNVKPFRFWKKKPHQGFKMIKTCCFKNEGCFNPLYLQEIYKEMNVFNLFYLLEIQHVLCIVACANHVIIFQKRTLIEQLWVFLSIYIFSPPVILIKHPSFFQATCAW